MSTQGERIEALETEVRALIEKLHTFGETLAAIQAAQDAGANGETVDLNQLTADVESLKLQGAALANVSQMIGELSAAETLEFADGFDAHGELLKAHRNIEFIARSLNIGLPS